VGRLCHPADKLPLLPRSTQLELREPAPKVTSVRSAKATNKRSTVERWANPRAHLTRFQSMCLDDTVIGGKLRIRIMLVSKVY